MTNPQPLLSLARLACNAGGQADRKALADSLTDWPALLRQAEAEGMDGVLLDWLRREGLMAAIQTDLRRILKKRHTHRLLDDQIKRQALEELLQSAEQAGIRLMVLQGMAIDEELYPAGIRPLSDIDLLIRENQLEAMHTLLSRLGYTPVSRYPPVYARDGVCIDLHQQLAYLSRSEPAVNPLRIEEDTLWASAVRRPFGARQTWTLSPIDQIIILSAHLQKHSFGRLIWFVDIGRLLGRLDARTRLDDVRRRAQELSLEQPLYFVCAYLHCVIKLPRLQSDPLPAPSMHWAARRLEKWLTAGHRIDGMGDLLYLLAIPHLPARWRFLRHTLAPKPEMMRDQVRSSSAIDLTWGYLNRVARLSWQAVRLATRLLRRRGWETSR
ncbi:MAG: nucleotidyltransferase family protein [Nitrospirae bacterium]|nr:nucleotidyltransferase family protein [Nitrospirota bacterium]